MREGTVRTAGLLAGQSTADLRRIQEHLRSVMNEFETPRGFELPMPGLLTQAALPPS